MSNKAEEDDEEGNKQNGDEEAGEREGGGAITTTSQHNTNNNEATNYTAGHDDPPLSVLRLACPALELKGLGDSTTSNNGLQEPESEPALSATENEEDSFTSTAEELVQGDTEYVGAFHVAGTSEAVLEEEEPAELESNGESDSAPPQDMPPLVVANLVLSPNNNSGLPLAHKMHHRDALRGRRKSNRYILCFLASGLFLLIGFTVTLVLLLRGSGNPNESSKVPTAPISSSLEPATPLASEQYVLALLPNYTLDAMQVSNSPQSLAYEFILNDPSLSTYPDWRIKQRFALATFFHATGGHQWIKKDGWLTNQHECSWFARSTFGISYGTMNETVYPRPCDDDDPRGVYRTMWQWSNGLNGALPPEIYWLTSLRSISLYGNAMTGSLSSQMGLLKDLVGINVAYAGLTGQLPTEIGALTQLKYLVLTNNAMATSLPTELGRLSLLRYLMMDVNPLVSSLPTELGGCTNMEMMLLDTAGLTGTIPSELGNLSSMKAMLLNRNLLVGTIPRELGNLEVMYDLFLRENALTGHIPSELGQLTGLIHLYLERNALTGQIPQEIEALPLLVRLDIRGNAALSGTVPIGLCDLPLWKNGQPGFTFDCSQYPCGCDCGC